MSEQETPATTSANVEEAQMRISAKVAVVEVLKAARKPLEAQEIVALVLDNPQVQLSGKTPKSTVAAILSTESRKENGLLSKTGKATYGLREWDGKAQE